MRDPDLVVRAQQAATALESAWCRWRSVHGLTADPAPAVSSYVGFSLEAPWGQPRIVFGICAEEAEQLATLLDRHDCVGPVHASVKAKPVGPTHGSRGQDGADVQVPDSGLARAAMTPEAMTPDAMAHEGLAPALASEGFSPEGVAAEGRAQEQEVAVADAARPVTQPSFVHVPAPAPASAGQQPLAASASSRAAAPPPAPPGLRPREAAAAALTSQVAPRRSGIGTPIALAASRAVEASIASRREAAASAKSAATPPAGPDDAIESGAASAPAGPGDSLRAPSAESSPEPPGASAGFPESTGLGESAGLRESAGLGESAGSARPVERPVPIRPGDNTQIMTGGPGPRDLGRADDRRAVGDRRLAREIEPDDARDAVTGQPDSAPSEIVAFRPRPEPAAYYADGQDVAPTAAEPGDVGGSPRLAGPAGPQAGGEPARSGLVLRGGSLARLKRPGSRVSDHAQEGGEPQPQDGRDRVGSTAASDAAAWNASELPGQAAITDTAV